MSDGSPNISPGSSPKDIHDNATQATQNESQKQASSIRSRSASASYRVFRRDIIYRSINEFKLSGRRVNAYSELLSNLSFDLIPLVADGETWYRCRGKSASDRPCRRLIPELYLRTAIGKILTTAEKSDRKGDELIEELAEGLSYAICSEHHPAIHRIARAAECYRIVEEYRREQRSYERVTTPVREDSPVPSQAQWAIEEQIREALSRAPSLDPKPFRTGSAPEVDPMVSYEQAEMVKVQRNYRDYLNRTASIRTSSRGPSVRTSSRGPSIRTSSRGPSIRASSRSRRRGSDASSTASPIDRPTERRWRTLERPSS